MSPVAVRDVVGQVRRNATRICGTLGSRFGDDARDGVLGDALEAVGPLLLEAPAHLSGRGGPPATEDERGFLDAELDDIERGWRSRVLALSRDVTRKGVASLVKRRKHPSPNDPRCLVQYADTVRGDDEHALQGSDAPGTCPVNGGRRESRFAPANWARLEEVWAVERVDMKRGPVPLTAAFEREEFWSQVRAFAARTRPAGLPSARALARILEATSCPAELVIDSQTEPRDVYQNYRGGKRVQRAVPVVSFASKVAA